MLDGGACLALCAPWRIPHTRRASLMKNHGRRLWRHGQSLLLQEGSSRYATCCRCLAGECAALCGFCNAGHIERQRFCTGIAARCSRRRAPPTASDCFHSRPKNLILSVFSCPQKGSRAVVSSTKDGITCEIFLLFGGGSPPPHCSVLHQPWDRGPLPKRLRHCFRAGHSSLTTQCLRHAVEQEHRAAYLQLLARLFPTKAISISPGAFTQILISPFLFRLSQITLIRQAQRHRWEEPVLGMQCCSSSTASSVEIRREAPRRCR